MEEYRPDGAEVAAAWLAAFAVGVPQEVLQQRVLAEGNFLWHIFSWTLVPCLCGDAAREAFDDLEYESALMFGSGFAYNGTQIEELHLTGKISAAELDEYDDVYVVDRAYGWTYVHTHEERCGPYFCRKEPVEQQTAKS